MTHHRSYRSKINLSILVIATATNCALAGTQTQTFNSSAKVNPQCNAVTAGAMAFGTYVPDAATDQTASSTVSVSCTKTTPIQISLNKGTTTGATTAARKLASGSDTLNYNLYSDSSRSSIWDDASNKVAGTGAGLSTKLDFTVYGKIPSGQVDTVPGDYSDVVTVTVSY
jgi:spore coat protein U-like protein